MIGLIPVVVPPPPPPTKEPYWPCHEVAGAPGETVCWVCEQPAPTERTSP